MSEKVTLPSGATVTLKDPSLLRVKDRKALMRAAEKSEGELSRALAIGDAVIAMLVEEWSYDLIIPSIKIESLDSLEIADYDALVEASKNAQKVLFPSLPDTVDNEQDPKATSANSNG